ncbi:MAG: PQQ-binding-like beta-propeller repeat protein [Phycisphaerae bacterium]|nr:MAG: hypothetical protein EDS66_13805 [Planctomycetota bacterium]KAB2938252.1 MAG: PQQ-binding-like beta-propeller repeat protein [Phycisphaerae bacterium]MBE7455014.1 PQQ-binding-like beta-propeller repeat protein [Planctomycetia bacterium]MCK6464750.1 PQQ-binding-like beta-propeller repeat protein [Phycisphaerae bacterium]MCL4718913.1 PQQ-binding-like beta-propeller repeat protein [Phycisphaerae bacterium]
MNVGSNWKLAHVVGTGLMLTSLRASAAVPQEWTRRLPSGSTLYSGLTGMVVDAEGHSFVVGNAGTSGNVDILAARYAPDGALVWSQTWDGVERWHDTVSDVALGPDGSVYAVGSTPDRNRYADLLVLKFNAADGALIWSRTFNGGPGISDAALVVATDRDGNVYAGGHTVGDGADCLIVKFDADGVFHWSQTWDGPASAPYSQEAVRDLLVAPDGDLVMLTDGVMATLHPDYVVIKYDAADGSMIWSRNWGVNGGDYPVDMEIDAAGDVYVTGDALNNGSVEYGTIKLRGSDGALLWAEYDAAGFREAAYALALDAEGGVYVTGWSDPHGDQSKFMHNLFTVKRDAATGSRWWTHEYGEACLWCYDAGGDLVIDDSGHVFVGGITSSPPYASDQIMLVLDAATGAELDRGIVWTTGSESAGVNVARLDRAQNLYLGGSVTNYDTGAVDVHVVKYASMSEGPDCGAIRKFSARCRDGKLTAKVVSSLPEGTELTLLRNGGDAKTVAINARGKGKAKWSGQGGSQTLRIEECPEVPEASTTCS